MTNTTNQPNSSSTTPPGSVAAPAATAESRPNRRSGLTGHILPSFWQAPIPASEHIPLRLPTLIAEPEAEKDEAPPVPMTGQIRHWWQRLIHLLFIDRLTLLLLGCAVVSLGIYLYGTLSFPLAAHLTPPSQNIGELTSLAPDQYDPAAGEFFLLAIALLFGAWGLVCWVAGRAERRARAGWWRVPFLLRYPLFYVPAVALLILLFLYPITAVDVFDYTSQIRVLTIYHANPLTTAPAAFPGDSFLPFNPWNMLPSAYGPLWILLSALISRLAGDYFFAAVMYHKLLTLVACLGCMGLVWLLAKRLCPERRWQAFVFFAWNPLVLFEIGGNGHNDAVMVFFLLAGLYALLAQRWYWQALALPLLVAGVLVKWTPILLIPFAIVYLLRGGRRRRWGLPALGLGTVLTAAYAIPLIAPFWDTQHAPGVWLQASYFTASLPALLHSLLTPIYGDQTAGLLTHGLALGGFGIVYVFLLVGLAWPAPYQRLKPWRQFTPPQRLLAASVDAYFWYFVLATFWFQPWYLVALLPLAALDPRLLARTRAALFSLGALLSYIIYIFLWKIYWWTLPVFTVDLAACFVIYGLALFTYSLERWQVRQTVYGVLARTQITPLPADEDEPRRRRSWWLL